jgi:penicillin-binding protein 2
VNEFFPNSGSAITPNRIRFLQILFFSLIALFAGRLFTLQVIMGGSFKRKAQNVSQSVTEIPAQRGEIFDRTYNLPLVLNIDSFALDIIPAEVPAEMRDTVFQKLAAIVPMPIEDIRKKISPKNYHFYKPIEIKNQVPYETIASIAERIDEFPGVAWHDKPIRNYIETGSFSHIIGYVGDISQEELQVLYNKGYKTGDIIGKTGIEKVYDAYLRGKDGSEYRTVDAKGKSIDTDSVMLDEPEMGKNLVLTIDRNMQILCEKALGERMGSIVVLKPSTGEVLAMVSYPYYSPNLLSGETMSKEYQKLAADKNSPLINRNIQSAYPPASTFKIVMTSSILEEKAIPPDKKIDCLGSITYGDRIFRCHLHSGHGWLNLQQALAQSCDVYFYTAAKDYLGIDTITHYARDEFDFGSPTGIDLPGEISGFVPTPQWKERKLHEKWLGGDTINTSIGQGFTTVTPLQMADMVAMVVNDGVIYKPHLLKEIRDAGSGALVKRIEPEVLKKSTISADTFKTVKVNMRSVITEGTAQYPVNIKTVQIAGKTGTAEVNLADHWHSWLASYAPYNYQSMDDVIVVAVSVEATNEWEWWAPYATSIIYQGIFGDQTYEEAVKALGLPVQAKQQGKRE